MRAADLEIELAAECPYRREDHSVGKPVNIVPAGEFKVDDRKPPAIPVGVIELEVTMTECEPQWHLMNRALCGCYHIYEPHFKG
jgi:hypothetical protein